MKPRILLFEARSPWQDTLSAALSEGSVLTIVKAYDEAQAALEDGPYDYAVIDLWLDLSLNERDSDNNGTHDALELVIHIAQRVQGTKLIIVSDSEARQALQNTPGVPRESLFLERQTEAITAEQVRQAVYEPHSIDRILGSEAVITLDYEAPIGNSRPGKPRILIVDDQLFWLNTMAELMEEQGYFWRVAMRYRQTIARLRLESFHIVLFNPAMGDPDAWQALDHLVTHCPKTKLIIISGHLDSGSVARLLMGYPVKSFIDKNTFSKEALIAGIQEQLAGPSLRIQTLGDFRVWQDGRLVNNFRLPHAETVIKILLTRRGEPVSVEEMLQILWPGEEPKQSYQRLGEAVNAARLALEPDLPRPSDSRLILRDGANYRFDISGNLEIDSEQLQQLVIEGRRFARRGEAAAALRNYEQVRELYQGDYLPGDRASAWTVQKRTALQALYSESLNHMADLYAGQDKLDLAIDAANKALQTDAYAESTYRRLMRYHACKGDKAAALAVYRALVKLFSEFFNEEPSEKTRELKDDIEAGRSVECVEMSSATGEWRVAAGS